MERILIGRFDCSTELTFVRSVLHDFERIGSKDSSHLSFWACDFIENDMIMHIRFTMTRRTVMGFASRRFNIERNLKTGKNRQHAFKSITPNTQIAYQTPFKRRFQ